jgi:Leucine-rich repeat (LRR) protein
MNKLNIFLLFNFFLIINSESCQNNIWNGCNCSITQNDKNSNNNLELILDNCKKKLKEIPEIQNIIAIYIVGDYYSKIISSLPDNLISNENCFYKNVTRLVITNTMINSINNSDFKCLSKLWQLDLSLNELTSIDANVFNNLAEIFELFLSSNKITSVGQNSFCELSELNRLDMQDNFIEVLPENICFPINLEKLNLSYNQIKSKIY